VSTLLQRNRMQRQAAVYNLPFPSVDAVDRAYWDGRGTLVHLRLEYTRDGERYRSGIGFSDIAALRQRVERCCTPWHIQSFDTLVEVHDSTWVEELRSDMTPHWRDHWAMHHYMIYLDSAGCFEIIANAWSLVPEERDVSPRS
jgi:hypothetical protein